LHISISLHTIICCEFLSCIPFIFCCAHTLFLILVSIRFCLMGLQFASRNELTGPGKIQKVEAVFLSNLALKIQRIVSLPLQNRKIAVDSNLKTPGVAPPDICLASVMFLNSCYFRFHCYQCHHHMQSLQFAFVFLRIGSSFLTKQGATKLSKFTLSTYASLHHPLRNRHFVYTKLPNNNHVASE
jgi:hypothetical protein